MDDAARMVDVGAKDVTNREATAECTICQQECTGCGCTKNPTATDDP